MGFESVPYSLEPFRENLKKARKQAGFKTQLALSLAMDVSLETVRNWEQGRTFPETNTLFRIAKLLKCDIDYLVGRIDPPTHKIQDIHKDTGLSIDAIMAIQTMDEENIKSLSKLLEHKDFIKILQGIAELSDENTISAWESDITKLHMKEVISNINSTSPRKPIPVAIVEKSMLYNISTTLTNVIKDITDTEA